MTPYAMSVNASTVRQIAQDAGFDLVAFGPPAPDPAHAERFLAWLESGRAGEMDYLQRNRERIVDPQRWAPGASSTIALARDYGRESFELPGGGRIARYATGRDYHRSLGNAAGAIRKKLEAEGVPHGSIKIGTDSVPVLERSLAARAGIGFLAKSAGVISPELGPYLLLAEVMVPFELPFDDLALGSCGTCTRCIDACPTQAITAPFEVDARRCLSYSTIELRGSIPEPLREAQGNWLFGCDVCLEVCPFGQTRGRATGSGGSKPTDLDTHRALEQYDLVGILELSQEQWDRDWTGIAMRRATRSGLRRNAAVVLGNLGDQRGQEPLEQGLFDEDEIVREHAAWALGRVAPRSPALLRAQQIETQGKVRQAIEAALERR